MAPDPQVGDRVGAYALEELLGRGGAASVFRATRDDGRVVALKVLAADKVTRPRIVQRFYDEARIASSVINPVIVEFVELVELSTPRRLAYAMEFVNGQSLRARLQLGTAIPLPEVIHIAQQLCLGVGALHAVGIIHRDLKPENIMLVSERGRPPTVKLLDFGVAKHVSQPADGQPPIKVDAPGTFVGTPRYMAPEQAAGGQVDARADLFAIGVMLFEMIAGQRPHEGDTLKAVVMAKLKGAPRLTMNPDREILPAELGEVVDACLKLQTELRPPDAAALGRVLDQARLVLDIVGTVRMSGGGVVRVPTEGGAGGLTGAGGGGGAPEARPQAAALRNSAAVPAPVPPPATTPTTAPPSAAAPAAALPTADLGWATANSAGDPTRVFLGRLGIALLVAVVLSLVVAGLMLVFAPRDEVYVVPPSAPGAPGG